MDIFYLFQLIASLRLLFALHSSRLICGLPLFLTVFEHLRVYVIKASCLPVRDTFAVRPSTSSTEPECQQQIEMPLTPSMRLLALFPFLLLFVVRVARTSVPSISISSTRANSNLLQIGFLSSFRYGQGKNIAGAIPLAIDHINAYAVNAQLPILSFLITSAIQSLMIDWRRL